MAENQILAKIRETGRNGDYAAARKLMKRHADKLPRWRMQKEWGEGYREAMNATR